MEHTGTQEVDQDVQQDQDTLQEPQVKAEEELEERKDLALVLPQALSTQVAEVAEDAEARAPASQEDQD